MKMTETHWLLVLGAIILTPVVLLFAFVYDRSLNYSESRVFVAHQQSRFKAVIVYDDDCQASYAVWRPADPVRNLNGDWLFIMLPGTELGFSCSEWDDEAKKFVSKGSTPGKRGGPAPLRPGIIFDDITLYSYARMRDGNYVVFRDLKTNRVNPMKPEPMFSVWTPELFQAVLSHQNQEP